MKVDIGKWSNFVVKAIEAVEHLLSWSLEYYLEYMKQNYEIL